MNEQPSPIRLLLIDDHTLFRESLAQGLTSQPDFYVAGAVASVDQAVDLIRSEPIHLVLLDINLGVEQGGSFLNRAKGAGYRGKILVVTAGVTEREASWLLARGCSGIFLKNDPSQVLFQRIREIAAGSSKLDAVSVKAVIAQIQTAHVEAPRRLTARELDVLRAVCEGLTNKEIGVKLAISENSVKSFLQQLFTKAGVRSRAQLVRIALERYQSELGL